MRKLALIAMFVALTGFAVAQTPDDAKKLDGKYKPESVQFEGKEQMPDAKTRAMMTLVVKEGEYRMYYLSDAQKDLHVRVFVADMKFDHQAKTFELTVKEGQKKGNKVHGTFEKMDDKLKLCYGPVDKPRPTNFTTAAGSGLFSEVWVVQK